MKAVLLLIWAAAAGLCATLLVGVLDRDLLSPAQAVYEYVGTFLAVGVGLLVWRRRPESRTGPLLVAFSFAAVLPDLWIVFRSSALAVTIGLATIELIVPLFGHLVLSYPTGRLTSRLDRVLVATGYVFAVAYALPLLLFFDPESPRERDLVSCAVCADPLTRVGWQDVTGYRDVMDAALAGLALIFLAVLARKIVRAGPGHRSVVGPLSVAAAFVAGEFIVQIAIFGTQVDSWTNDTWFWIVTTTGLVVPFALGAGLLWGRTARSAVADLVVDLEHTPPGSVRDALARALGDPSLELALWLPEQRAFVGDDGTPVELPANGAERAVTLLGPPDAPLAALVHDPALLERKALLDAAGAAARLALENARLQAALRAQLAELRASRARIVAAGDEERRRLERDLHDGAQQRLLAVGLALQLARGAVGNGAAARDLLDEADGELREALDELRELARGIHPAVLTEQGLGAALQTLAERSPVPVAVSEQVDGRLAPPTEAAIYFLVSEALANVAKHAAASRVTVIVVRVDGRVLVDIDDDGVGGADAAHGSGLRGLTDRVHALEGELRVESAPGQGTHVHAELPCA